MSVVTYPLGHAPRELDRLAQQSALLREPLLEQLAASARSCLEIGCGNGANWPLLRAANPTLRYTGIDLSVEAIAAAQAHHANDPQAHFHVMSADALAFAPASFDLVFTKLVLWSLGPTWQAVLGSAVKLLTTGGTFYAMEPCNQLIELQPEKPAARAWMRAWDEAASLHGFDSAIGSKVPGELMALGLADVGARFHPVSALGDDPATYGALIDNLEGFYFGPAATRFGLDLNSPAALAARAELAVRQRASFVMDALFVAHGRRE